MTDTYAQSRPEQEKNQIIRSERSTPEENRQRKREWNRGPLLDLFPRIPEAALERVLDICIDKEFTYNLSEARRWNARRYTCIVVAHVRHFYTDYDALLQREFVERYEARQRTSAEVWKVLRRWCPWDDSNSLLEPCFCATLQRPEEREPGWDPMDIDDESDYAPKYRRDERAADEYSDDDPMELD